MDGGYNNYSHPATDATVNPCQFDDDLLLQLFADDYSYMEVSGFPNIVVPQTYSFQCNHGPMTWMILGYMPQNHGKVPYFG